MNRFRGMRSLRHGRPRSDDGIVVNVLKDKPSAMDVSLQRLAHISQFVLLVVAVLGYYYTVRPVFQYQLLQERSAELETERSSTINEIKSLKTERDHVEEQLTTLGKELEDVVSRNEQLKLETQHILIREQAAKRELASATSDFNAAKGLLDAVRWDLVWNQLNSLDLYVTYNSIVEYGNTTARASNGESWNFFTAASEHWPSPYSMMLETVSLARDRLKKHSRVPDTYLDQVLEVIEQHRESLICERPDFNALQSDYRQQLEANEALIDREVQAKIRQMRDEYSAKGQRLKITDEYLKSIQSTIRFGKTFELQENFRNKVGKSRTQCLARTGQVWQAISKLAGQAQ